MTMHDFVCPGAITAVETKDGKLAIIDGQHRVGAIKILHDEGQLDQDTTILLEVHRVETEADIAKLFTDINRSVPVQLVDMPDTVGASDKESLHGAAAALQSQFPAMFSASTKCRVPHLNFDTFRDDVYRSKVMAGNDLKTKDDLI